METMMKQNQEFSMHTYAFPSLIASLVILWFIKKRLYKPSENKKNLPPSPPKLPILGNLHQLGPLTHKELKSLANKHGPDLMLLHIGSVPTLIVSSSKAAREIMKTHDIAFSDKQQPKAGKRLLYECRDVSLAPYGEYWRQLKSICVLNLLSNKRVQSFHSIREEETSLLMDKIREASFSGRPVNLSEMFTEIMNNVACRSAFGRKYCEGDDGRKILMLLREFVEVLGTISVGEFIPWLWWINRVNGFEARVERIAKDLDEFLEGVIRERLEISPHTQGRIAENFVDILLDVISSQNGTGVTIDRDSIKAIILDVFAAGTDSTSTVIEWAMSELLRNPTNLKMLQNEVREILKGQKTITCEDIEKMHYLKAVVKETLRFHTPNPLLVPRVAREDVKVMGYDIPAGTMVITNAWAISRDSLVWDEPEKFKPERFFNSLTDYKGLDFEFIPFGAGRRSCPGIAFAMANNELLLAKLMQNFDWKLPDGERGEDLDMSERPGIAIRRLFPLVVAPILV